MLHISLFGRSLTPPDADAPPAVVKKLQAQRQSRAPARRLWPKLPEKASEAAPFIGQTLGAAYLSEAREQTKWEPRTNFSVLQTGKERNMTPSTIRIATASLFAIAVAGCTTTGVGTGQSANGRLGATFTWTESGGTRGTMVAQLSNGQVFQGPMFQITQESRVMDYGGLWNGWGAGFGWGRGWGGRRWGGGWGGWGPWGPDEQTITHYSGQVLANLQGPGGFMRCHFTLMSPSSGMAGGGVGQCQLPTGSIINAQFPRH